MEYLPLILSVALIHLLAVASPGPDFIMVTRNSLVYSRQSGIYTAIGLGLGILLHVTYSLLGIALIISQSVLLFSIIKYLGAAYLIYIGIKSLLAKRSKQANLETSHINKDLTKLQAIRIGFLTNATNPKATLFFLSVFTLVIQPSTPLDIKMIMGAEMAIATAVWFAIIATLVSHRIIKIRIMKIQHHIERIMGGILIVFGIVLATAHSK
jgi:RhtB (resistance to homoserine/threonine) family protein